MMEHLVNARFMKLDDGQMYSVDPTDLKGKYIELSAVDAIRSIVKHQMCELFIDQSRKGTIKATQILA